MPPSATFTNITAQINLKVTGSIITFPPTDGVSMTTKVIRTFVKTIQKAIRKQYTVSHKNVYFFQSISLQNYAERQPRVTFERSVKSPGQL